MLPQNLPDAICRVKHLLLWQVHPDGRTKHPINATRLYGDLLQTGVTDPANQFRMRLKGFLTHLRYRFDAVRVIALFKQCS